MTYRASVRTRLLRLYLYVRTHTHVDLLALLLKAHLFGLRALIGRNKSCFWRGRTRPRDLCDGPDVRATHLRLSLSMIATNTIVRIQATSKRTISLPHPHIEHLSLFLLPSGSLFPHSICLSYSLSFSLSLSMLPRLFSVNKCMRGRTSHSIPSPPPSPENNTWICGLAIVENIYFITRFSFSLVPLSKSG